jgi:hypothetical protein
MNYFDRFFEEKDLPYQEWEIEDKDGLTHFIDSEVVIEAIKNAPENEQAAIETMLTKIDFVNGDVLDYLHHLAKALVAKWSE